eukprot:TRINITY_DN6848_c0_g1_i26.p6 TRINITY_DN6848_c0_g1~~TRINITY_DN6848_c0_g1_i26.p6  ORF type:complete len:129 (-),score=32.47 TRINITY_DN6848_c0_g1_i26:64-450(-)
MLRKSKHLFNITSHRDIAIEFPEVLFKNLPLKDPTINYREQAKILAMANVALREQIGQLRQERDELREAVHEVEEAKREESSKEQPVRRTYLRQELALESGRKRYRRNAAEIERPYKCPYSPCNKAYG